MPECALRTILVAVDGSPPAWEAQELASTLALRERAKLIVCGVVDRPAVYAASAEMVGVNPAPLWESFEAEVQAVLEEAARKCGEVGLVVEKLAAEGDPATEILASARSSGADCIVMGTHRRTGSARLFLGSVADRVIRAAPVPVLVTGKSPEARPASKPADPFAHMLVALDDSEPGEAAIETAVLWGKGRRLTFCTVVDTRSLVDPRALEAFDAQSFVLQRRQEGQALLDAALEKARAAGVEADSMLCDGAVAHEIVEAAGSRGATAIAIGTHGRRGIGHFVLGSVAEEVLRGSTIPVLVIGARCDL